MTFAPQNPLFRTLMTVALLGVAVGRGTAQAGEVFDGDGLLALLPVGDAPVGSTVELHVVALDGAGAPLEGMTLKVAPAKGSAGPVKEVAPGLYAFALTLPSAPGPVKLVLEGKRADKTAVRFEHTVKATARVAPERIAATSEPSSLVLSGEAKATLSVAATSPQGVVARASVGTLASPVRKPDGGTTIAFVPPKVNFPQVAIVTFADAGSPTESFGAELLPLSGSVAYPVSAPAGSSVTLKVAGRTFGPVEIGSTGKGKVPIEVPPGVDDAEQVTVADGSTSTKALDLGIPPAKRLAMVPPPKTVAAGAEVPLVVMVATRKGAADNDAAPVFAVSSGSISGIERVGEGLYRVRFTAPKTPGTIQVTTTLDRDVDVDKVSFEVVPAHSGTVGLASDPWPPTGDTASVTATGTGVPASSIQFSVAGGELGEVMVLGDKATAGISAIDVDTLRVGTGLTLPASADGVRHVVMLPDRHHVLPGGSSYVVVATVDEDGLPVANQQVAVSVVRGEGTVPATVQTGADGTTEFVVSASSVGVLGLSAASGGYTSSVGLIVADAAAQVPALPAGGPIAAQWRATHPALVPPGVAGEVATPWGEVAAAEPVPAPEPAAPVAPVEPVAPVPVDARPSADPPWLRLRASAVLSSYRYEQTPSDQPGNVLNRSLSVGGEAGSPASPAGFELDGRVWLDAANVPYLGFHAAMRNTWYSIQSASFATPATDQLFNAEIELLGRVPFDVGAERFWVGAAAGFHYDDFIFFEGCIDQPGCSVGYAPLSVPGLGLGPELGAEIGRVYVVGGYTIGLANFSQPYRNAFDLNVGVRVVGSAFVDVGFGTVTRRVDLVGAESLTVRGQLSDAQMMLDLGVGVGF